MFQTDSRKWLAMQPYEAMQVPPAAWRKASFCGKNECVEIAAYNGAVVVRNSAQPHIAPLSFTTEEFATFLMGAKAGEFDDLGR
jgi:Domain of unknown function (DUF397)